MKKVIFLVLMLVLVFIGVIIFRSLLISKTIAPEQISKRIVTQAEIPQKVGFQFESVNHSEKSISKKIAEPLKSNLTKHEILIRGVKSFSEKDYSNLDSVQNSYYFCSVFKGMEKYEQYTDEYGDSSTLSLEYFELCNSFKDLNYSDIKSYFYEAVSNNISEGEFALGLFIPDGFSEKYYWLTRASTWNEEAIFYIRDSIFTAKGVDSKMKYFWLEQAKFTSDVLDSSLVDLEIVLELELSEEQRYDIITVTQKYALAEDQSERFELLKSLELI